MFFLLVTSIAYLDPEDDHSQVTLGRNLKTLVRADQELEALRQMYALEKGAGRKCHQLSYTQHQVVPYACIIATVDLYARNGTRRS